MDSEMGQSVSTPPTSPVPTIEVTVKFVMAGKTNFLVRVPTVCTVRGLKTIIAEKSEVYPDKQLLLYKDNELRDDDSQISNYGMIADCQVTMSVNMNTGVRKTGGGGSGVFYVPVNLPQESSGLRSTVRNMTTVKGKRENRPKRVTDKAPDNAQIWTPGKQLEVELTRNRMKALMHKKNKTRIMSPASGTPIDSGSMLCSRTHSPTQTPPNESSQHSSLTSRENQSKEAEEDKEVTEKELKLFFEPMETLEQLRRLRRQTSLAPPPQSLEELEELKKKTALIEKTTCKTCGKKVPPAEQTMRCHCRSLFCRKHRDPQSHLCKIDYKQTGRKSIHRWMLKVGEGGARKGKPV